MLCSCHVWVHSQHFPGACVCTFLVSGHNVHVCVHSPHWVLCVCIAHTCSLTCVHSPLVPYVCVQFSLSPCDVCMCAFHLTPAASCGYSFLSFSWLLVCVPYTQPSICVFPTLSASRVCALPIVTAVRVCIPHSHLASSECSPHSQLLCMCIPCSLS